MDFSKMTCLVAGTGISGIGAAKLLGKKGAAVILYDGNDKLSKEEIAAKLGNDVTAEIVLGQLPEAVIEQSDIMVLSPGIAIDAPFVNAVRDAGVPIWGEVELAYVCGAGQVAAITGTNGKTTTTALVGEIFKNYFDSAFVVGNIGTAYTSVADQMKENSVTAAEISSFQLETIRTFHPKVSAVLNITPDHLNRHYTMENYTNVKVSVSKNQTKDDVCVLNYEDSRLREAAAGIPARVVYFSSKQPVENGAYYKDGSMYFTDGTNTEEILKVNEMNLVGMHNVENVMAAALITYYMGVPMEVIRQTIRTFKAVEHRIEYVAEKNGVLYYNDSKGTNTDASIQAVKAMSRPTYLIAGGYDKGSEYDDWIATFGTTIKKLVLLGATKDKIAKAAKEQGFTEYVFVDSLEEAVAYCSKEAVPGEAVLLSPACASWDMFKSYEQRGTLFKEYVNAL
jgi:UDP-N-acetylmuramoylalanine--D-glutamate ligase